MCGPAHKAHLKYVYKGGDGFVNHYKNQSHYIVLALDLITLQLNSGLIIDIFLDPIKTRVMV